MHARYPINVADLKSLGAPWMTQALRSNNTIAQDVTVTSLNIEDNENGGLLGEMCRVSVEFNKETDCGTVFMCKFQPADFMTKVTTRLFDLCIHEYLWYKNIQPTYPIRIPKMIYGDYNHRAGSFIMLFEMIDGEFYRCENKESLTVDRAEQIIKLLAQHHALGWGGQLPGQDTSWCADADAGANRMLPPESKKHIKTFWDLKTNPAKPDVCPEILQEHLGLWFNNFEKLQSHFTHSPWKTINHGDPRLDNFFFNEKNNEQSIGLLDWQLIVKAGCAGDLSWFVCTSVTDEFATQHWDGLMALYFAELQKNLTDAQNAAYNFTLDELKEELGMAHVFSMGKIVIGSGGLDTNDPNNIIVMKNLATNGLAAMMRDNTKECVDKFNRGELLAQRSSGGGTESKSMELGGV